MAESKQNPLSDMLNITRQTFLNTMESLGKSNMQLESVISGFFKKGTMAQDSLNTVIRKSLDIVQQMTQDFTDSFNYFANQSQGYLEKLGDFPYKDQLGGLMTRLTDETKEALSWFKVYKMK